MKKAYDFVVLGGGSAGYAAARTAVELGLKTAVVDGAEPLGGLCILRGCMPSKTLIESANRNLTLRRASEFGLRASNLEVHPREIRDRKRALISDFAGYRQEQLQRGDFDLHRGTGRYLDAHTIEVALNDGGTLQLDAATSIVATGSTIRAVPLPGLEDTGYLTSDDLLDADTIPDSIIVLGGGAIALEMAHFLEAVGSKVTIVQRSPHVLSDLDHDLAEVVEEAFRKRGMAVYTGTKIEKVETSPDGLKVVHFEHAGRGVAVQAHAILYALGRSPATIDLGLETAGVDMDGSRIQVRADQSSSVPGIFAAGDVCSPIEVVHLAIEQGEIAAHNAAVHLARTDAGGREIDYRLKLLGIFTEPQVATVGLGENEAKAADIPYDVASSPFDDHGKSMVMGETEGFVKLIVHEQSREIIGASVVGPEAVDLIHEIVVAMHFRATATDLMSIPHYHPTLSEIWTYPAEDLAD